jgi:RNA polymerase sigma factor (sigma-70 family)
VSAELQKGKIAEFFRKERRGLLDHVRRLFTDTAERDGEDIVQDVMVSLFSAADISAPIEDLSAYIYRSLRNRVVDVFRRRKKTLSLDSPMGEQEELTALDLLSDARYDVESELERREFRRALSAAMERLNPDQRRVFIATALENRTFRELSDAWDMPVGTLLSQKHRAVGIIRSALKDYAPDAARTGSAKTGKGDQK